LKETWRKRLAWHEFWLEKVMETPALARPTIFAFDDYELDLHSQELRCSGYPVHLEPQVFALLVLLIENRDRIVSKDEILDVIWAGRIVSEAALSSRINAARRAVGDTGQSQGLIRTHHKRGFRFVGEVREIARGTEQSSVEPQRSSLQEPAVGGQSAKPAVAVLPFANVGEDPEHDYFAYGLTEDVIRLLGRHRWLRVLTRHSGRHFDPHETSATEVGAILGVRYIVRGSVRRVGTRARVTVDLSETAGASHLWSEAYDIELSDIFGIQEEIARQIAALIEPELATAERELAARKPPSNLDAWDCYQRGLYHPWGFTTPGFDEAELMFRRAIALEPDLARAHAGLSYVALQKAFYGDLGRRGQSLELALAEGDAAVRLDDRDSFTHCVLGRAYCLRKDYGAAIAQLKQAIDLNPSFAQG
jgi:TolB-like protein